MWQISAWSYVGFKGKRVAADVRFKVKSLPETGRCSDRGAGGARLAGFGELGWLDLSDQTLEALAIVYRTFDDDAPAAPRLLCWLLRNDHPGLARFVDTTRDLLERGALQVD